MNDDLYRKEAFESKIKGFSNPVTIRGSLSAVVMTVGLLALLAGLLIYAWVTPYDRKVTAQGFVMPRSGAIEVRSPATGVAKLVVGNGVDVAADEVVAIVTDSLAGEAENNDIQLQINALTARREMLDQRIVLIERRLESTKITSKMRIENGERHRVGRARILSLQRDAYEVAEQARVRAKSLSDSGLVTRASLDEYEKTVIQVSQNLIDAEVAETEAAEAVESARIDREISLNAISESLIEIRSERISISNEIDRLSAARNVEIRAPVAGTVTFSQTRSLERVNAEESVFIIDPAEDDYIAMVLAPSSAIGFLTAGDAVQIRYDAYPYRENGVFRGTVRSIDHTAQPPTAKTLPLGINEPVYRVRVDIDQAPIGKRGQPLRLVSNMTLEASIIADRKPILMWLIDPVAG